MRLFRLAMRWPTLVVASVIHLLWGMTLVLSPSANHSTPLYPLRVFSAPAVGLALIGFALLGFWAVTRDRTSWSTLLALLPQQTVLIISACGVIVSIIAGRFLDGVMRPRGFLFADHLALLALAVMHSIVLTMMHAGLWLDPRDSKEEKGGRHEQ